MLWNVLRDKLKNVDEKVIKKTLIIGVLKLVESTFEVHRGYFDERKV